jgi:hypothetical protein
MFEGAKSADFVERFLGEMTRKTLKYGKIYVTLPGTELPSNGRRR